MRCRKVRSLLSATSFKDEIATRLQAIIREHLSTCSSCRLEASYYESIHDAGTKLASIAVSDNFNNKLLNRIANERFQETRTKAHLPSPAPRFPWRVLAPVLASAALVIMVAVNVFVTSGTTDSSLPIADISGSLDNSYQTVQPLHNPNMTSNLQQQWTLNERIAQAERFQRISQMMVTPSGFGQTHLTSAGQYQPRYTIRYRRVPTYPAPVGFNSTRRIYKVSGNSGRGVGDRIY